MVFNKIAIWNEANSVKKILRTGFDLILFEQSEIEKLSNNSLELYQVFDEKHNPLIVASRKAVVKLNLICEAVHIYIFDEKGRILLQKRASNKDTYPNCFAPSTAGRINFGENIFDGAKRELKEELGLDTELIHMGTTKVFTKLSSEFDHVFIGITSKKPKPNEEMQSINYYPLSELKKFDSKNSVPALQLELKEHLPKMKKILASKLNKSFKSSPNKTA